MVRVERWLVLADSADDPSTRQSSVSVRLDALLDDGRRLTVLDGRGWDSRHSDDSPVWPQESADGVQDAALTVIGPDRPVLGETAEEVEAWHWRHLAEILAAQGVDSDPDALAALPSEVELSPRIRVLLRLDG
jgi:hypothetical protein